MDDKEAKAYVDEIYSEIRPRWSEQVTLSLFQRIKAKA
jgi:hypothetical protein